MPRLRLRIFFAGIPIRPIADVTGIGGVEDGIKPLPLSFILPPPDSAEGLGGEGAEMPDERWQHDYPTRDRTGYASGN